MSLIWLFDPWYLHRQVEEGRYKTANPVTKWDRCQAWSYWQPLQKMTKFGLCGCTACTSALPSWWEVKGDPTRPVATVKEDPLWIG